MHHIIPGCVESFHDQAAKLKEKTQYKKKLQSLRSCHLFMFECRQNTSGVCKNWHLASFVKISKWIQLIFSWTCWYWVGFCAKKYQLKSCWRLSIWNSSDENGFGCKGSITEFWHLMCVSYPELIETALLPFVPIYDC